MVFYFMQAKLDSEKRYQASLIGRKIPWQENDQVPGRGISKGPANSDVLGVHTVGILIVMMTMYVRCSQCARADTIFKLRSICVCQSLKLLRVQMDEV